MQTGTNAYLEVAQISQFVSILRPFVSILFPSDEFPDSNFK
jgi:hypothetical protein